MLRLWYLWKNFDKWHPAMQGLFYAVAIIVMCLTLAKCKGVIW